MKETLKILIIYLFMLINNVKLNYNNIYPNKPKISIFLPIYNKELYLKNCILNLQQQTFKNIELIAINDGSTDNSLKILKKLSKQDKRIKIINNDRNHGLLYSRAMGVSNSTGEYLMNLDPDDKLVSKNDLNSLYKISKTKKYDLIIFLIKRIAVNRSDISYFKYLDENQLNSTDYYITNKLIKKEIFLKALNEFKDEIFDGLWNYHEDNIWNCLVRKHAKSITIFNKYIYSYKRNKDSLNAKKGNIIYIKNIFDRLKKFKKMNYLNTHYLQYNLKDELHNYNILKNNELKHFIFQVLINYMKYFNNKTSIYKNLNLILDKLAEEKIIVFYNYTNTNLNFHRNDKTFFESIIMKHKYIISIDCNNINRIKDIKNYIFSNDILIFLNNLILSPELKPLIESHKNKKIIAFVNGKISKNKLYGYESLKIYVCNS